MCSSRHNYKVYANILKVIHHVLCDVKCWDMGASSQERILEVRLVQIGGLIKARGQDPWEERAVLGL